MSDKKLSLHIASKNVTVLTSGFVDMPAIPEITAKLSLNRQSIAALNEGGGSGPAGVTIAGATRTIKPATHSAPASCWPCMSVEFICW